MLTWLLEYPEKDILINIEKCFLSVVHVHVYHGRVEQLIFHHKSWKCFSH